MVPSGLLLGVMVWSVLAQNPVASWLLGGAWATFFVAAIVRASRARTPGHPSGPVPGPAFDDPDDALSIHLGRPGIGRVVYGASGAPDTELVIDRVEPDPGDLSRADTEPGARRPSGS